MKLVDTSCWIEALRPAGDVTTRQLVYDLMDDGEAAWCEAVRLELRNSSRGKQDARQLDYLDAYLPLMPITQEVLGDSVDLAILAREKGITVPAMDLLIAACARHHGVEVESRDKHFDRLLSL